VPLRSLGRTGLSVSRLGFGAFKIGRNEKTKYADSYELPDDESVDRLLNGLLALGINLIDTAPAYGESEQRIGKMLAHRREDFFLSTKVGETFTGGVSTYDFSAAAVRHSIDRSRRNLRTEVLDLVFVHSDGNDREILENTDVVETLVQLKSSGTVRAIGFSGKTVHGARQALDWADAIMVEYHCDDRSHEPLLVEARQRQVGVVVKKGLASGALRAGDAIQFVLQNPCVDSMIIGSLNLNHIRENVQAAESVCKKVHTPAHANGQGDALVSRTEIPDSRFASNTRR
jgi:aryl-alcohol dehydrogenase-like predicted oxidoreductase